MSVSPAGVGADGGRGGHTIPASGVPPTRPRGPWCRVFRWSLVFAVLAVGWLLAEHIRGRRKLEVLVADQGIRLTQEVQRWGPRRSSPSDPRFLQAARIARSLESVRTQAPPVLVQVGPGQALPMSEIDWWISKRNQSSNTWAALKIAVDGCRPETDQILGLMDGRLHAHSGYADFAQDADRRDSLAALCLVLRVHALGGMRERNIEPVMAALRALETLADSQLASDWTPARNLFRDEAESIRLGATLVRDPEDAWLAAIAPSGRQFKFASGWMDAERAEFEERVSQLRFLPHGELGRRVMVLCVEPNPAWIEFPPCDSGYPMRAAYRGLVECVCFPVWRFGWGDLSTAGYIESHGRKMASGRKAVESCAWRVYAQEHQDMALDAGLGTYTLLCYSRKFEDRLSNDCRHLTDVGLNAARIALLRYGLRHGEYPEQLAQLVPDYLHAVPTDWMNGEPLRYQRHDTCGFRIRSCGDDGEDHGGHIRGSLISLTLDATAGKRPWAQEGYDLVWPSRAGDSRKEEFLRRVERDHLESLKWKSAGNPYGMDPVLMRRYGLLPKTLPSQTNLPPVAGGKASLDGKAIAK